MRIHLNPNTGNSTKRAGIDWTTRQEKLDGLNCEATIRELNTVADWLSALQSRKVDYRAVIANEDELIEMLGQDGFDEVLTVAGTCPGVPCGV